MVEVFKTNVQRSYSAKIILNQIRLVFPFLQVNFDLEDCDKILRVEYVDPDFNPLKLLKFLENYGIEAEVLADSNYLLDQELNELI